MVKRGHGGFSAWKRLGNENVIEKGEKKDQRGVLWLFQSVESASK